MRNVERNVAVWIFAALFTAAHAQEPSKVDPSTLIREGILLYDQGNYKGAIEKYTRALAEDANNAEALYERALAYLAQKDYAACMQDAEKGMKLDSPLRPAFYTTAGNCHSMQDQNEKALKYYEDGLKLFPHDEHLHFNMAVTLSKIGRTSQARNHLKEVLFVSPNRPSGNLYLALLFHRDGYRVPAIFMYLRFLVVEPTSERAKTAVARAIALLEEGVERKDANNISVSINPEVPTDEGDFGPIDLGATFSMAASLGEEGPSKSRGERLCKALLDMVQFAEELEDARLKKTFVWQHAIGLLIEMKKARALEAFLYQELDLLGTEGCKTWLDGHAAEVEHSQRWIAEKVGT